MMRPGSMCASSKEGVGAVGIIKGPDDLAFRVDPVDIRRERSRHVDRRVYAVNKDEAVVRARLVNVQPDDLAGVVDGLGDRDGAPGTSRVV